MRWSPVLVALTLALGLAWPWAPARHAVADAPTELQLLGPARVRIEAGTFMMGSDEADVAYAVRLCRGAGNDGACMPERFANEQPRHRVQTRAYLIDRTEVTHAAYGRCVGASACAPPRLSADDVRLGHPTHPVAGVTQAEAARYCAWVGGQLPTEAQWERAARGSSPRRFPWGQHYNSRVANHGESGAEADLLDGYRFAAPVGALLGGRSAHGLLDMAGNVWELTADRYAEGAYAKHARVDPVGAAEGQDHVVRGGSWRSPAFALRATHRGQLGSNESRPDVGFRCAYNVPSAGDARKSR